MRRRGALIVALCAFLAFAGVVGAVDTQKVQEQAQSSLAHEVAYDTAPVIVTNSGQVQSIERAPQFDASPAPSSRGSHMRRRMIGRNIVVEEEEDDRQTRSMTPRQHSSPASPSSPAPPPKKDQMTILWWTTNGAEPYHYRVAKCRHVPECGVDVEVTPDLSKQDSAAALVFNAFDMITHPKPDPKKKDGQPWVMFSMEPPSYYAAVMANRTVLDHFDLSMTYRFDSDVPVPYTPDHLEDIFQTRRRTPPPREPHKANAKIFFMSSNCRARSERFKFMQRLKELIPIDSYGHCFHDHDFPSDYKQLGNIGPADKEKNVYAIGPLYEFLSAYGYKFIMAFENSNCKDYMSEKYWRALESGLVPIYLGAPNVAEYLPDPNAIINLADYEKQPEKLAERLKDLLAHEDKYQAMLEWKKRRHVPDKLQHYFDMVKEDRWCRLCSAVKKYQAGHRPPKPQPDMTCPKEQYATLKQARIAAGVDPDPNEKKKRKFLF